MGIALALFIMLQAGSALLIDLSESRAPHSHAHSESVAQQSNHHEEDESIWHESLAFVHHGGGTVGFLYRFLLGIGMVGMAASGIMIFFKIRACTRKG